MPELGGKYIVPAWSNGTAPAIDEDELQAMSNTLALTNMDFESSTGTVPISMTVMGTDFYQWVFAFGNGIIVGVSNGDTAIYSEDGGQTWTTATLPDDAAWSGVVFGGGYFVACNSDGSTAREAYSKDGKTWTACSGTGSSLIAGVDITYGDGRFMVGAGNGTIIYADDPTGTWTQDGTAFPSSGTSNFRGMCYGNGVFVSFSPISGKTTYSTDKGDNWTSCDGKLTGDNSDVGIAYGNGVFVAVASGSSNAAWSSNGSTWTTASLPATTHYTWSDVVFGAGVFIASGGTDNVFAISADGKTWTLVTSPATSFGQWYKGVYGDGKFLFNQYNHAQTVSLEPVLYRRIMEKLGPDIRNMLQDYGLA